MKKYEHIKIKIETITPDRAKRLIESTNGENYRKSASRRVDTYASDQARGMWLLNGDTICITDGIVYDGMHRMYSCVQSGTSFDTIVVYGLPKEVFKTKDRGRPRTLHQELEFMGYKNAKALSAVTSAWFQLSRNMWAESKRKHESSTEVIDFFLANELKLKDVVKVSVKQSGGFKISEFVSPTIFGAVMLEATSLTFDKPSDSEQVLGFAKELSSGESEFVGSPALALRNRLMRYKKGGKSAHETLSTKMLRALVIHAWNLYCAGESVTGGLTYRLSGVNGARFPEVEQATS